jgi:hypothetical protein
MDTLIFAFGGGIAGTALGGLSAWLACCLLNLIAIAIVMGGGSDWMLWWVGLGPGFGPQVGGFTCAAFATAYACGIKKNHPTNVGKDILSPMMDTSWDVLLVGGIWGPIGHIICTLLFQVPIINMFDVIALTVVIGMVVPRWIFMKTPPWGDMESIKKHGWLGTGENYEIAWVPWRYPMSKIVIWGLGVGLFSGGMCKGFQQALAPFVESGQCSGLAAFVAPILIVWAIGGFMLMGLNYATGTIQKFPIWHGEGIIPGIAYFYWESFLICGIVGIVYSLFQDLMSRMWYNHGNTHIDPPACAICGMRFVLELAKKIMPAAG